MMIISPVRKTNAKPVCVGKKKKQGNTKPNISTKLLSFFTFNPCIIDILLNLFPVIIFSQGQQAQTGVLYSNKNTEKNHCILINRNVPFPHVYSGMNDNRIIA